MSENASSQGQMSPSSVTAPNGHSLPQVKPCPLVGAAVICFTSHTAGKPDNRQTLKSQPQGEASHPPVLEDQLARTQPADSAKLRGRDHPPGLPGDERLRPGRRPPTTRRSPNTVASAAAAELLAHRLRVAACSLRWAGVGSVATSDVTLFAGRDARGVQWVQPVARGSRECTT